MFFLLLFSVSNEVEQLTNTGQWSVCWLFVIVIIIVVVIAILLFVNSLKDNSKENQIWIQITEWMWMTDYMKWSFHFDSIHSPAVTICSPFVVCLIKYKVIGDHFVKVHFFVRQIERQWLNETKICWKKVFALQFLPLSADFWQKLWE